MKRIRPPLLLFLSILLFSCEKDSFPENDALIGTWFEITFLLDSESLSFKEKDTLFYTKFGDRYVTTDTLLYRLDKKKELLHLKPAKYPDSSETSHKIVLDKTKTVLSIWGLRDSQQNNMQNFEKQ